MSVYQRNPDAPPDSAFEPGELGHLVAGNRGRMLDPRRTPVSVVELRPATGTFILRIEDFEDRGALWEIPLENVGHYQFARGSPRADGPRVRELAEAAARHDRPMSIACEPQARRRTEARLDEAVREAAGWLERESRFVAAGSGLPPAEDLAGDALLQADLRRFMAQRGLEEVEAGFARRYVSNPESGDLVKGHRIVIAELGLVPYEGKVVRDPAIFDGAWSRAARAGHVVARLAFMRALLARIGLSRVTVYRGLSTEEPVRPPGNRTFVSATFSRRVAESHFDAAGPPAAAILARQDVPAGRVFMSFYETAAMNEPFREAEAVLLHDPANPVF